MVETPKIIIDIITGFKDITNRLYFLCRDGAYRKEEFGHNFNRGDFRVEYNCAIYSIKRVDGQEFKVGDRVNCTGGFSSGTIHSFKEYGVEIGIESYFTATVTNLNPLLRSQEVNIKCFSHA